MGAGITATSADAKSPEPPEPGSAGIGAPERLRMEQRVTAYLKAMGVTDEEALGRLRQRVLRRVEVRASVVHMGEPLEAAIAETHLLLDQWLVSELGLEGDANALSAARAAVLGGRVADWALRWAGLTQVSLREALRAARIVAVPEPAPLVMEPNPIRLCCHRLGRRLLARVGRLLGLGGESGGPIKGRS